MGSIAALDDGAQAGSEHSKLGADTNTQAPSLGLSPERFAINREECDDNSCERDENSCERRNCSDCLPIDPC